MGRYIAMRIAIFSRWNATCGISLHAELLGREFINLGHEILVFAPYVNSANRWWHHKIIKDDEDYVIRCYYENDPIEGTSGRVDEDKILQHKFDVLLVESDRCIPYRSVEKLVSKLRGKCPVILVIHEGLKEHIQYSDLSIFDAIVVFDNRYINEVIGNGKHGNIHIIPYPCHPPVSRKRRAFGEDLIKFFSFGRQPINEYDDYINTLSWLDKLLHLRFRYLVIRSDQPLPYKASWLIQNTGRLPTSEIYKILQDVDVHFIPKANTRKVVVSSTFYQTVGSLTPIIAPYTRHFEAIPKINGMKPIILYRNIEELKSVVIKIIEDNKFRRKIIDTMRKFALKNSSRIIAQKFLILFESLFESI